MGEEVQILYQFFRKWTRTTKIALVLSLVALALGVLTFTTMMGIIPLPITKARISIGKIEVVDEGGYPVFRIWLTANRWPVKLELFYKNETGAQMLSLGVALVNNSAELPAKITPIAFPFTLAWAFGQGPNLPPGLYIIMASTAEHTTTKGMRLEGAKLAITDWGMWITYWYSPYEEYWTIDNITLHVMNVGDCPAYVRYVNILVEELNLRSTYYLARTLTILPDQHKEFTATPFWSPMRIDRAGTYHVVFTINFGYDEFTYVAEVSFHPF